MRTGLWMVANMYTLAQMRRYGLIMALLGLFAGVNLASLVWFAAWRLLR